MAVRAFEEEIERAIKKSFYSAVEQKIRDRAENLYKQVIDTYYTGHEYKQWYDLYKKAEGKMSVDFIKSSQIKDVIRAQLKTALNACRGTLRHEFNKQFDSPGSSANTIVRSIGFLSPPGYGKTKYVLSAVEELQREENMVEKFVFVDGLKYHTIFNPIASSLKTTTSLDSIIPTSANRKIIAGLIIKDRTLDPVDNQTLTYEQAIGNKKLHDILSYFVSGTGGRLLGNLASKEVAQIGKASHSNPLYSAVLTYVSAQNDTSVRDNIARKIVTQIYAASKLVENISKELSNDTLDINTFKSILLKHKNSKQEIFSIIQSIIHTLSVAIMLDFVITNDDMMYNKEVLKDIEVLSTYAALSDVFLGGALSGSGSNEAGGASISPLEHIKTYIDTSGSDYSNEATLIVQKLYVLLQVLYDKDRVSDGIFLVEDVKSFIDGTYPRHTYWGAIDKIAQSIAGTSGGTRFQSTRPSITRLLFEQDEVTHHPQNFGSLYLRTLANKKFFSNAEGGVSPERIAIIVDKVREQIKSMKASLETLSVTKEVNFYTNTLTAIQSVISAFPAVRGTTGIVEGFGDDIHQIVFNLSAHINNVHSHALAFLHPAFYMTEYSVNNQSDAIEEFVSKYISCQFFPEVSQYYYANFSPFSDSTAALTLAFESGIQELLHEAVTKYNANALTLKQEGIRISSKINEMSKEKPLSAIEKYNFIENQSSKVDEVINNTKLYVIIFDEILHNVTRENFAILLRIWDMLLNRSDFSRPNVYVILTGNSPSVQELSYIGQLLQSSGVSAKGQAGTTSSITAENISAFFARVDFYIVSPDYEYVLRNESGLTQEMTKLAEEVKSIEDISDIPAIDYFTTNMIVPRMTQFDYFEAILRSRFNEVIKQEQIENTDNISPITKVEMAVKLINNRLDNISEELRARLKRCQGSGSQDGKDDFFCQISKLKPYFDLTGFSLQDTGTAKNSIIRSLIKTSFKNQAQDYKLMFGIGYAPILLYTAIYDTLRTIPSLYNKTISSLLETLRTAPVEQSEIKSYNSALEDTMEAIESILDILRKTKTRKEISESYAMYYPVWIIYVLAAYKFIVNMSKMNPNILNVFSSLDPSAAYDHEFAKNIELFDLIFDRADFLSTKGQKVNRYMMLNANMKEVYRDISIDTYFLIAELKLVRAQDRNKLVACPFDVTIPDPAMKEAVRNFAKLLMIAVYRILSINSQQKISVAEKLARGIYYLLDINSNKFHISLRDYSNYIARVVNSVIGYVYMLNILKTVIEQDPDKFLSECCPNLPKDIQIAYKQLAAIVKKYAEHIISYNPQIHKSLHIYHDMSKQSSQEQSKYYYSEEVSNFLSLIGISNNISQSYSYDASIYDQIAKRETDSIFKNYFIDPLSVNNSVLNIIKSPIAGLCYLSMIAAEVSGTRSEKFSRLNDITKHVKKFINTGGSHIEVVSSGSTAKGLLHMKEITKWLYDILTISGIEVVEPEMNQSMAQVTLTSYLKSKNIQIINELDRVKNMLNLGDTLGWLNIGSKIKNKEDKIYKLYQLYSQGKEHVINKFIVFVESVVKDFLGSIEVPQPEKDPVNWIIQNTKKIVEILKHVLSMPDIQKELKEGVERVIKYLDPSRLDKQDILQVNYQMSIGKNTLLGMINNIVNEANIESTINKIKEIGLDKITSVLMSDEDKDLQSVLNDSLFGSPLFRIKFIWITLGAILIGAIQQNDTKALTEIINIIEEFDAKIYETQDNQKPHLYDFLKVVMKNRNNRSGRSVGSLVKVIYSQKIEVVDKETYKHELLNKYGYDPNERTLICNAHMVPIDSIIASGNIVVGVTPPDSIHKAIKLDDVVTVYSGFGGQKLDVLSDKELSIQYLIEPACKIKYKYEFAQSIAEQSMLIGAISYISNKLIREGNTSLGNEYINQVMPFVIANIYHYYNLHKLSDNPSINEIRSMVWGEKPLHPWLFVILVASNSGIITDKLHEKMNKDYGITTTMTTQDSAFSNKHISFIRYLSQQVKYRFSVSLIHPYMPVYEIQKET